MKIHQITDSRNQHIVAIEKDGELRCYFKNSSLHTAGAALSGLRRDLNRYGETVVKFDSLPKIHTRIAKTGRTTYEVADEVF